MTSYGTGCILPVMNTKHTTVATGPKLAYSYRRFSSKKQGDGSSLERQLQMAKEVCAEQGWHLVDLPPDEGVSAYKVNGDERLAANMHRGNLGAFLAKAKAGEIGSGAVLIIEKLDRFSRNVYDVVFPVWLNLLQSGVGIYSCVSRTHYTLETIRKNPMLAGMALIEMASANEYSSGLSQRVKKAIGIKIAAAASGKKLALGAWCPAWVDFIGSRGQPGEFKLNAHAETIRRMVREYVDGKSMFLIARGLQRDGVPSMRGGVWSQGSVASLLHNQCLAGDVTIKGVKLAGYVPPVLTKAEHAQLLGKLAENHDLRGGRRKGQGVRNIFRNRVRCSVCGGACATSGSGNYVYYGCLGRIRGTGCSAAGVVPVSRLEEDFFLLALQENPLVLLGKRAAKTNGALAALKARLRDLDKAIEDGANMLGKLPIKALEAKLTALVKQRDGVARELQAASSRMMTATAAPAAFENLKGTLAGFAKLGEEGYAGSKKEVMLAKASLELRRQLADGDIRQRLLNIIPALVNHLELDIPGKRYRVVNHANEVSGWRSVAGR